jgi:hypothetical protein
VSAPRRQRNPLDLLHRGKLRDDVLFLALYAAAGRFPLYIASATAVLPPQ